MRIGPPRERPLAREPSQLSLSEWHTRIMKNSEVDRLGERLRQAITAQDLTLLDSYRRGFRAAYDAVVDRIRTELGLQASGRPAKSTSAIVDKRRRGTMRIAQLKLDIRRSMINFMIAQRQAE